MALIAVASAKGSPGVTTTALLLGTLWPRPSVVVECDPSGGDVAWRMPAEDGTALDPQAGLLNLVAAGRRALHPGLIDAHSQRIVGGQRVVVGVTAPEQSGSVAWRELAEMFATAPGLDVIADLGRLGARTPQNTMIDAADAIVLVVDTVPSNVVHLRDRMARLQAAGTQARPPTRVVVVAEPKRKRAVHEVQDALQRSEARFEGVHHLAHDRSGAGFFLGQVRGRAERTNLVRSARPIVDSLAERVAASFRDVPEPGAPEDDAPAALQRPPGPSAGSAQ